LPTQATHRPAKIAYVQAFLYFTRSKYGYNFLLFAIRIPKLTMKYINPQIINVMMGGKSLKDKLSNILEIPQKKLVINGKTIIYIDAS
jgi:hypothetical protein